MMMWSVMSVRWLAIWSLLLLMAGGNSAWSGTDYRLDAGDKISIQVYGEESMDVSATLGASGVIRYPFLGNITAKGKTTGELESLIEAGLRDGYLVNPQVRVRIDEFRPFFVNGEVRNPGGFPYSQGLTLRKALSLAGGLNESADPGKVFVVREQDKTQKKQRIDMDAPIHPGDIVSVEKSYFYIYGEVKSPGKYPLTDGLTFRMAISLAGGFTERASTDTVQVRHEGDKNGTRKESELDGSVDSGDIVTVKQSFF
ncbi:polysaccharide export protein [Mariprofundus erugo]|nr:polysaccharide export protein [Mariprofundus erugo]